MARHLNVRLVLKTIATLLAIGLVALGVGRLASRDSSARILAKACELVAQNECDEAVPLFRIYLGTHPDDEKALMGYARALERTRSSGSAALLQETYRKVIKLNPRNYEALKRAAELSLAAARLRIRFSPDAPNEWAEAARLSKQMIEVAPDRVDGQRYLGMALIGLDQIDEGKAVLERLLDRHPTEEDAYFVIAEALARKDGASQAWRKYVELAIARNGSSPSVHLKAYSLYSGQGDSEAARKQLARALEVGPNEPEALAAAGVAYERGNEFALARECYGKLQQAAPSDPISYVALARLARRSGDREEALRILREGLLPVADKKAELLFWIADILLEQGGSKEADHALDQLRTVAPASPLLALLDGQRALNGRDDCAARGQLERAARGLEASIRAFPPLAQAHLVVGRRYADLVQAWSLLGRCYLALGVCYGRLGEVGAARETLAAASGIWPDSAAVKAAFAKALLAANDPDAAREQAEAAVRLAKDQRLGDPDPWLTLARVLRASAHAAKDRQAILRRAIETAEAAVAVRPTSHSIILLAQLHLDAGEHPLAERVLSRDVSDPKEALELHIARIILFASLKPPDLARARQEYAAAVERHGDVVELRLLTPLLLGPEAGFEAREKCLMDMLARASQADAPRIRGALAALYITSAKPQKAMAQLRAIAQSDPKSIAARKAAVDLAFEAGMPDQIPELLDELSDLEGQDAPDVVCFRAEYELTTGKPDTGHGKLVEVAEQIEALLRRSPTWRAWAILGDIRKLQGRVAEAVDCYQSAFKANPSALRAGLPLVRSLSETERHDEAAVILDRLARLDSPSPTLLELRLDQFRRQNDLGGAVGLLEDRLAREPQNAAILVTLADLYGARQEHDRAEKLLRTALAANPKDAGALDRLVGLLNRTKRADEALKLCDGLIAAEPEKPMGYVSRSRHHRLCGNTASAIADLKRALDLTPTGALAPRKSVLTNLAVVCAEQGDSDGALGWHRRAAALEPPGSAARRLLVERLLRSATEAHIQEAAKLASALLDEAPEDPHACLLKARIAELDPDTRSLAKELCNRAITLAPRMAQPYSLLSSIYESEGDLRRASDAASRAASYEPNSVPILLQHARLLRHNRQFAEARAILERASRLNPTDLRCTLAFAELAHAETGAAASVELLEKALVASESGGSQRRAALCVNLAWYLHKANRAAEAEVRLREACRVSGNSRESVESLARFLEEQKRYDETDSLLDQAMREADDGKNPALALLRAEMLLARNRSPRDLSNAERYVRQCLATQPDSSHATRLLAEVAVARKDVSEAEALYRKALLLNGRNSLAANQLAWLLCQAGRLEEAHPLARRAVALEPNNPEFQGTLGEICSRLGDLAQAERAFDRCVELRPNHAPALCRLGLILAKLGKAGPAKGMLTRALHLAGPDSPLTESQREEAERTLARLAQTEEH